MQYKKYTQKRRRIIGRFRRGFIPSSTFFYGHGRKSMFKYGSEPQRRAVKLRFKMTKTKLNRRPLKRKRTNDYKQKFDWILDKMPASRYTAYRELRKKFNKDIGTVIKKFM